MKIVKQRILPILIVLAVIMGLLFSTPVFGTQTINQQGYGYGYQTK